MLIFNNFSLQVKLGYVPSPSDTFLNAVYYFAQAGSNFEPVYIFEVIYGLQRASILLSKVIYGLQRARILLSKVIYRPKMDPDLK